MPIRLAKSYFVYMSLGVVSLTGLNLDVLIVGSTDLLYFILQFVNRRKFARSLESATYFDPNQNIFCTNPNSSMTSEQSG